ncbi:MAG: hypothetical protein NT038_02430 [Euryarchaeota archaeon]|nr:hypothetical protein [Euryarchaeota archaeon]
MFTDIQSTTASILLLSATVFFIIITIELKDLVKSVIALGIGSALLAGVFFILNAPFAAVFELSVCAGLVTILLLSAIGMLEKKEEAE